MPRELVGPYPQDMNTPSDLTLTNRLQDNRLGILVEPSQVRLKPNFDNLYT